MDDIKRLIKFDYEEKGITLKELSVKYNKSINTIKSWIQREEWKKKIKGAPKNAPKKKMGAMKNQSKKIKAQIDIIKDKPKSEIMQNHAIAERTYYKYRNEIRPLLIETSEKILKEVATEIYPDKKAALKKVAMKKKKIMNRIIEEIEKNLLDKDILMALNKSLMTVKSIQREMMNDLGIIGIEKQAEYEKQLIHENIDINRFELDKERITGKDDGDITTVLMKLKRSGISGLTEEELKVLEEFLNDENKELTSKD